MREKSEREYEAGLAAEKLKEEERLKNASLQVKEDLKVLSFVTVSYFH